MDYSYKFPAVKGKQAGEVFYITMVPCKLISKLFVFDYDDVSPEFRAQRKLNERRIPDITNYILSHRNSYVFSALASSIDGKFDFVGIQDDLGYLEVDMNSTFLINDGQHRANAIIKAIEEDETIGDETIPVVFFADKGLKRSQQMFTDLNKHAVNTSKSLNTLYDSNDDMSVLTKDVMNAVPFFKKYTEVEKDTLGKYSAKLFILNNLKKANENLLRNVKLDQDAKDYAIGFWSLVASSIREWEELESGEITKTYVRNECVITQGVILITIGMLGNYLKVNNIDYTKVIPKLKQIDWSRTNKEWIDTIMFKGKIQTSGRVRNAALEILKQHVL